MYAKKFYGYNKTSEGEIINFCKIQDLLLSKYKIMENK